MCFSSTMYFSLYYTATPPHLHSFPTRRSSDLDQADLQHLHGAVERQVDGDVAHHARLAPEIDVLVNLTWGGVFVRHCGTPDRKSTRLNSSHRCISYAVFCLKKKKKQTTR